MGSRLVDTEEIIGGVAVVAVFATIVAVIQFGPSWQTVLLPAGAVAGISSTVWSVAQYLSPSKAEQEEKNEAKAANKELLDEVTDYQRIIRTLDERDVDVLDILDDHVETTQFILIGFGNQDAPEELENGDDDHKFIKWGLKREFNLINLTPWVWLLPPEVVEAEGLENATADDLRTWVEDTVYAEYSDDYAGEILFMSVVDLHQTYSRTDLEGDDKAIETALVEELLEGSEELDSDSLGDALGEEMINLMDIVKEGTLMFFLPTTLTNEEVERIRESDTVTNELETVSLRTLAEESSVAPLAEGLAAIDIEEPRVVAEEIVAEAKMWRERLSEA